MSIGQVDNATSTLRNLDQNQKKFQQAAQSLSSGKKANLSPAALVVAEQLLSLSDSAEQAISNTQDAVNLTKTAQGGLQEIGNLVNDIHTLSVAAANGATNDPAVQQAYQTQIADSVQAIQQIAQQTQFNGKNLLDGSGSTTIQTGTDPGQTATFSTGDARPSSLGGASGQTLDQIDVSTTQGAAFALSTSTAAFVQTTQQSAALGAVQSANLEPNIRALGQAEASLADTISSLQDTNFGSTSADLVAAKTLAQAGLSVLRQSQQNVRQSLSLLA